jgi:hypothetical protein
MPTERAPSVHGFSFVLCVVTRSWQAPNYFPFVISKLIPGSQCFLATLRTSPVVVHMILLVNGTIVQSTNFSLLVAKQQAKACTLNFAHPVKTPNKNNLFTEASQSCNLTFRGVRMQQMIGRAHPQQ